MKTDGGTGHMHEYYDPNNPNNWTRDWFCWADALYSEFVLSLIPERCEGDMPHLEGI